MQDVQKIVSPLIETVENVIVGPLIAVLSFVCSGLNERGGSTAAHLSNFLPDSALIAPSVNGAASQSVEQSAAPPVLRPQVRSPSTPITANRSAPLTPVPTSGAAPEATVLDPASGEVDEGTT